MVSPRTCFRFYASQIAREAYFTATLFGLSSHHLGDLGEPVPREQWSKIARAVGTSVNRCLVHYYSAYKAGGGREGYLRRKKQWEQSDECEV